MIVELDRLALPLQLVLANSRSIETRRLNNLTFLRGLSYYAGRPFLALCACFYNKASQCASSLSATAVLSAAAKRFLLTISFW